jgi:hypothetical protein
MVAADLIGDLVPHPAVERQEHAREPVELLVHRQIRR